MVHPVVCPQECYFEKERAIEAIQKSKGYCPIHRWEKLTEGDLQECDWLEQEIEEFWKDLAQKDIPSFEIEEPDDSVEILESASECTNDKI